MMQADLIRFKRYNRKLWNRELKGQRILQVGPT